MAFSNAPKQQTYSSHRLPLVTTVAYRKGIQLVASPSNIADPRMINLLPKKEMDEGREALVSETRDAIYANKVSSTTDLPRGCYVWEKTVGTIYYFAVFGTKIYTSTNGTTWSNVTTFVTASNTPVGFTEFINSATNTKSLVIVDGVEGYVFTTNAAGTKITDVDFPSPHVPFPVVIDGYLFLAKSGTGDIYNSDLNDPTAWTAGSYISSELYPDDIQALVKINNYLLAIGTSGCEYFYDAATASGSPLARHEGASLPFGTLVPTSIAVNKDTVMFLANSSDGGGMILKKIEGLAHKDIEATSIIQTLNQSLNTTSYSTTSPYFRGFFMRHGGSLLYVLNINGQVNSGFGHPCFCYSLETDIWVQFALGTYTYFPVFFAASSTSTQLSTYIQGLESSTGFFGYFITTQTSLAKDILDFNAAGDVDKWGITTTIVTPTVSFGTLNRKIMSRFGVKCVLDNYSASDSITVAWSDNEYTNDLYQQRQLYLTDSSGNYLDFPFFTQLGSFRQRSFKLTYSGTKYIKYYYIEVDINKGQQ